MVKDFGIVNKAEIDVFFWNSLAFLMTQQLLTIWSQIPLAFLNPAWISASLWFMYYPSLAWKILNITSLWDECNYTEVWTFVGIAFLWDWNESWPFPVLWPLLSFPNCWHIECSTFTASSFKIWNSSTGAPSPPLALFTEMLSKTHLTSHSRMSGSRWMITPSWLSGSWRSFLYSSSVYFCHLFLI